MQTSHNETCRVQSTQDNGTPDRRGSESPAKGISCFESVNALEEGGLSFRHGMGFPFCLRFSPLYSIKVSLVPGRVSKEGERI